MDKIINADDFGASDEINRAVAEAFQKGCLTSASIMMNGASAGNAAALARENPGLKIGAHLVLTEGPAMAAPKPAPLLAGSDGRLKHGFVRLLWLSLTRPRALTEQAEAEWRAQIEAALGHGLEISHVDSHRHVHMIPKLFDLARRLQREYKIPRIRIVNEDLARSASVARCPVCFFDGGAVKCAALKTFYYLNRVRSDTYFYGLVYTGRIWGPRARVTAPEGYGAVEVALHPRAVTDNKRCDFATAMDVSFPERILSKR
jgi:predicted glycoside hydrolase/deacetylase ChbG (UPF0249 family)